MKARVYISLKPGVLDVQGQAIEKGLHSLGFGSARDVHFGKFVELTLDAKSQEDAKKEVSAMCEKLLANLVVESYRVEVLP